MSNAPTVIDGRDVAVTTTSLTLHRPLAELNEALAAAICGWLNAHGIDPLIVATQTLIERDSTVSCVSWREYGPYGMTVRTRVPAVSPDEVWPAAFPSELLAHVEQGPAALALAG
jgi:hypothetical protein